MPDECFLDDDEWPDDDRPDDDDPEDDDEPKTCLICDHDLDSDDDGYCKSCIHGPLT